MESIGSVVRDIVADPIKSNIKNFMERESNFATLEDYMIRLKEVRDRVKASSLRENQLEHNERAKVEGWLEQVDDLEAEVNGLGLSRSADGNGLLRSVIGFPKQCTRSRRLMACKKKAEQLMGSAESIEKVVNFQHRPRPVEHIPGPSIEYQDTAARNLARLSNLLKDDSVTRIGVCGMGGIGKTTLVRNLNNRLASSFSIVIWVTVSKDTNLRRIQTQILERLDGKEKMEVCDERVHILLHQKLQKEMRFLLILDDVWEQIDLDAVGIPSHKQCPGSKIIITSRSVDVCRQMNIKSIFEVKVLNYEEAWELFCEKAGDVVMKEDIRPLAKKVLEECGGLPLAITVVGASMIGKSDIRLWDDVLTLLKNAESIGDGMKNKVFQSIKWSYDSLKGKNHKLCLLCCCLYPEDCLIMKDELITYWFCEGLLDASLSYKESKNRGLAIIQSLKDFCLLEEVEDVSEYFPSVKMHDVVRDVGIWIACSGEDECRSLVRSGMGLSCISNDELSTCSSYKRISFMRNKITSLADCGVQCPEASVLLLNENKDLETVPASFLEGFEALKILNLSHTRIECLPPLEKLSHLRALILRKCPRLRELPHMDGLTNLLVLDCEGSPINELPSSLHKLRNLRVLNLFGTELQIIPFDSISRLSNLESFSISNSDSDPTLIDGQKLFQALPNLKKLSELKVVVDCVPRLTDVKWFEQIKLFQIGIGCYISGSANCNCLRIKGFNLSREPIGWLLGRAGQLSLNNCDGLIDMFRRSAINSINSVSGSCFPYLKALYIQDCKMSLDEGAEEATTSAPSHDMLPNLEAISFRRVKAMKSITQFGNFLGLRFTNLCGIDIAECPQLRFIFSLEKNRALWKLRGLDVSNCDFLECLFRYPVSTELQVTDASNLQRMHMNSIETFTLCNCNRIKRLPVCKDEGDIKIEGERGWWDNLEWDDEDTKIKMERYLSCTSPWRKKMRMKRPPEEKNGRIDGEEKKRKG